MRKAATETLSQLQIEQKRASSALARYLRREERKVLIMFDKRMTPVEEVATKTSGVIAWIKRAFLRGHKGIKTEKEGAFQSPGSVQENGSAPGTVNV